MSVQIKMFKELKEKSIFDLARHHAFEYIDGIDQMDVFPSDENLKNLAFFDHVLQRQPGNAEEIISSLHTYGSPATTAQTGGRYFGFVDGGAVPVSLGVKWLADVWDQCGGLYLTSPINAKLEAVCERWLKDLFRLPDETVAGFVSGTSMANLSALAAARYHLLKNQDWDINKKGMNGAPAIRVVAHEQVHASVRTTLAILGFGLDRIEWISSDNQGRMVSEELPALDNKTLVLLQAGNVNTGAFDPINEVCEKANEAGAWVHIDGAFGLWAAATQNFKHLTCGMEKASSWAVDGHKTLNTPYDSGIVLCRHPKSLFHALQATGDYLIFGEHRNPIYYGPEMSKRSRAIELWATLKYLGKDGIDEMITRFNQHAKRLADALQKMGFKLHNEVVFNQVLVSASSDEETNHITEYIQNSGKAWLSGSRWKNQAAIRISICSWATTDKDIDQTIQLFEQGASSASRHDHG